MSQRRSFTRRDALLFAGLGVAATLLTPAKLFADPQSDLEAASAQLDSLGAALAEATAIYGFVIAVLIIMMLK